MIECWRQTASPRSGICSCATHLLCGYLASAAGLLHGSSTPRRQGSPFLSASSRLFFFRAANNCARLSSQTGFITSLMENHKQQRQSKAPRQRQLIGQKPCWGTRTCADCSWWRAADRPPARHNNTCHHFKYSYTQDREGTLTVFLLFCAAICAAASAKCSRNSSVALVVAATDSWGWLRRLQYYLFVQIDNVIVDTAEMLQTWSLSFMILRTLAFGRETGLWMPACIIARWSSADTADTAEDFIVVRNPVNIWSTKLSSAESK